ncbi:hypothetical protein DFH06DRAFT_910375, partial [Mycena polygramma]
MISLCRAKCWIIQLKDDDSTSSIPLAQRGVRGHIIIYPQKPSAVAASLPPRIDDVTTPICVIFVGSKPPTPQCLKEKTKPLTVRKERVQKALEWLKIHNHLYADVPVNQETLAALPEDGILPFEIQHVLPSATVESSTSEYVPGTSVPTVPPAQLPVLADILHAPPPNVPFQSVVVANVDGNAPSHLLRSSALEHMRQPGSNYIELPHGPKPVNEFNNRHLFPMMYPTLFPYGLGGPEDDRRRSKLAFKTHIKH